MNRFEILRRMVLRNGLTGLTPRAVQSLLGLNGPVTIRTDGNTVRVASQADDLDLTVTVDVKVVES